MTIDRFIALMAALTIVTGCLSCVPRALWLDWWFRASGGDRLVLATMVELSACDFNDSMVKTNAGLNGVLALTVYRQVFRRFVKDIDALKVEDQDMLATCMTRAINRLRDARKIAVLYPDDILDVTPCDPERGLMFTMRLAVLLGRVYLVKMEPGMAPEDLRGQKEID